MSFQPLEVFMDWFDMYELRNFGIHTDTEPYTQTVTPSQTFSVEAVTNITESEAVEVSLNFQKKDNSIVTKKYETYVTNERISDKFTIEDLANEFNEDINNIVSIHATARYEDQEFKSNLATITRILRSKQFKDNGVLNDIAEKRLHKAYKKTTPIKEDEEVKLIQKALKRMDIVTTIDGKYGNDTKVAVEKFQSNYKPTHKTHQYDWAQSPDGIVGRNTLLALDEALVEGWGYVESEVNDVRVLFTNGTNDNDLASSTVAILKKIGQKSGNAKIYITSTARKASDQARIMFTNCKRTGAAKQKIIYGVYGDKVIDVYIQALKDKKTDVETVQLMTQKINELGASKVSKHCADTSMRNVFDIDKNRLKHKIEFTKEAKKITSIERILDENNCYHLEVKL